MSKIYYLLLLLFSFSMLSAQEKLSKEEKARREKNIQAGNPFVKYGSKAPVATLSKGKYLEVHDLDSIVIIGTSRWDVDNKKIVGDIKIDSLNVDAQPIGDAPGMWMSPDPLSEEFPSWSPYNMCMDNPIRMIDKDGKAPDDWIVHLNSEGKTAVTYDANVHSKAEAEKAGYKGVSDVFKSGSISGHSSSGEAYNYKLNGNGTVTNSQGQTTNQGFTTPQGTWVSENPIGRYNMFFNGFKNTVLGFTGSIGAIAAAPETGGSSAVVGLPLTVSAAGIGFGQMLNAFQSNVDQDLQHFSTLPGLGAARSGNQYAPLIDGVSTWATGSFNSPFMMGNSAEFLKSGSQLLSGQNVFKNALSVYGTYDAAKALNAGVSEPKKDN